MKTLLRICLFCSLLLETRADILKFDEEDMRNLRASDPYDLLSFPPSYAFSQALQLAKENGYRYFSFIFYECNLGNYQTTAYFVPPSISGEILLYSDDWVSLEIIGYIDEPDELDVFDIKGYKIILGENEIDDELDPPSEK